MTSRVYLCDGKKFIWKAYVSASLIEEETKCDRCNGHGYTNTFHGGVGDDDNDGKCPKCCGKGRITWHGPMFFDNEVQQFLQKQLDKYIEDKNRFMKENPPFIGMGI